MWSIILVIIVFLPIINLLATILHLCKVIDANNVLINFSLLKNIRAFIPRRIANKSTESDKKFKNPTELFDGIRLFWQIVELVTHFFIQLYHDEMIKLLERDDYVRHPIEYFALTYFRWGLNTFFLFNGIASGKWFYHQVKKDPAQSTFKLSARFILERFLTNGPIFYIYFFSFLYYIRFQAMDRMAEHNLTNVCSSDSIVPNILFFANYVDVPPPVSLCKPWVTKLVVLSGGNIAGVAKEVKTRDSQVS